MRVFHTLLDIFQLSRALLQLANICFCASMSPFGTQGFKGLRYSTISDSHITLHLLRTCTDTKSYLHFPSPSLCFLCFLSLCPSPKYAEREREKSWHYHNSASHQSSSHTLPSLGLQYAWDTIQNSPLCTLVVWSSVHVSGTTSSLLQSMPRKKAEHKLPSGNRD